MKKLTVRQLKAIYTAAERVASLNGRYSCAALHAAYGENLARRYSRFYGQIPGTFWLTCAATTPVAQEFGYSNPDYTWPLSEELANLRVLLLLNFAEANS